MKKLFIAFSHITTFLSLFLINPSHNQKRKLDILKENLMDKTNSKIKVLSIEDLSHGSQDDHAGS